MSTEKPLPKDPMSAAEILAALKTKDEDETICRYPTCDDPRSPAHKGGRPSAYCLNPEHTAVTNHRARQQLRATAEGATKEAVVSPKQSGQVTEAFVSSLRDSVLSRITQLQSEMERYLTALAEMGDPDLSAAQIQTARDEAIARVAEAELRASTERSLRMAAQEEARTEREAAELAIGHMEETEARLKLLQAETEQHIAEVQAERDTTIDRMRGEMERRREEIETQAREAIAKAEDLTLAAQGEAREASVRANETETRASAQIATSERLVAEARTTLDRERAEVDRLRAELVATVSEARMHAETERAEYRATLDRERAEVDRIRAELGTARTQGEAATTRADQLAASNDELRAQLVQIQVKEREKTNQQQGIVHDS